MTAEYKTKSELLSKIQALQNRLAELEAAEKARESAVKTRWESEERYRKLFKLASDSIVLIDAETSEIVEFNDQAHRNLGYSRAEFQRLKISDLDINESAEDTKAKSEELLQGRSDAFETKHRRKDGVIRDVLVSGTHIVVKNKNYILTIWRDITERKKIERNLREQEAELTAQAQSLQETNTALKVLLKHRNVEKERIEENVLVSVRQLIKPYLQRLQKTGLDAEQANLVRIISANLDEIISPFVPKISSSAIGLTPRELEVANLVKSGFTNQEVGDALCLSANAVAFHRRNIRTKMQLTGKKVNLRTHLQNLA